MTGTICSVSTCKSNREEAKKKGESIRFFTFPKKPNIRKQWIRLCYRKDKFCPNNKRICSRHFEENQYEDIIHAKLTNTQPKKLKQTAIPTLRLKPEKGDVTDRSKRLQIKERKETVANLLFYTDLPLAITEIQENLEPNIEELPSTSKESPYEKYMALQKECHTLKTEMLNNKKEKDILLQENKKLQGIIDDSNRTLEVKVKELLANCLTPNQIDIMLKKKTKAR